MKKAVWISVLFTVVLSVSAQSFRPVIHWDMETLTSEGYVKNLVADSEYADCHLRLEGAVLGQDSEQGSVLVFNGEGALAESTQPFGKHRGVRIIATIKNNMPAGQSSLIEAPKCFVLLQRAQSAAFRFASKQNRGASSNMNNALGLKAGVWTVVTATVDPANGAAGVCCGSKCGEIVFKAGDALRGGNVPLIMGDKIKQFFNGSVADVQIEVMD
jgi:hypothetical protein